MSALRSLRVPFFVAALAFVPAAPAADPVDIADLATAKPRLKPGAGKIKPSIPVKGRDFDLAARVKTDFKTKTEDIAIGLTTSGPVAVGDVLDLQVWLNFEETPLANRYTGRVTADFKAGGKRIKKRKFQVKEGWWLYRIPLQADFAAAPGEATIDLYFGERAQTVLIGPVKLLNYGPGVPLDSLAEGLFSYQGREPDAAWRAEADARIQKYRTGPLEVSVVDRRGNPAEDAEVRVEMRKHAFGFGSACNAEMLTYTEEEFTDRRSGKPQRGWTWDDALKCRELFRNYFTRLTPEPLFRPHIYQQHRNPKRTKSPFRSGLLAKAYNRLGRFSRTFGVELRGHYLSWGAMQHGPQKKHSKSRDDHYRYQVAIVDRTPAEVGDLVREWDTINHPCGWALTMEDLYGGLDMHVEIMRRARESAPPAVKHYVNEGNVLAEGSQRKNYARIIDYLIANGQGPDGIGMMGHFNAQTLVGMNEAWDVLEMYAGRAPELGVTELDVAAPGDPRLQADYLRDIMTVCFSHPQMTEIVMWGFWEKNHWKPVAALWNADWTPRPAAEEWLRLVGEEWRTDETVAAGPRGRVTIPHAFYGDYSVTATSGRRKGVAKVRHLADEPGKVEVVIR